MKKFVFATILCLTAMAAQAQIITKDIVAKQYEDAVTSQQSEFAYNAEYEDGAITTLYVYNKVERKKNLELRPVFMYQYNYDAAGLLLCRTKYGWNHRMGDWQCLGRLDFSYAADSYNVEYSRWNAKNAQFDNPVDKMTYTLLPDASVNHVYCYHRDHASDDLRLCSQMTVDVLPFFPDDYLMHADK